MPEPNKPFRKVRNPILVDDAAVAKLLREYLLDENWDGDTPRKPLPHSIARDLLLNHANAALRQRELLLRLAEVAASARKRWEAGEVATTEAAFLVRAMYEVIDGLTGIQCHDALKLMLDLASLAEGRELPEASFVPEPKSRSAAGRPHRSYPATILRQRVVAGIEILMKAGRSEEQSLAFVGKRLHEIDRPTPVNTIRHWRQDVTSLPSTSSDRFLYDLVLARWQSIQSVPELKARADPEEFVAHYIHARHDLR